MQIVGFPAGIFQTNCYLVADSDGACVIVDPGQDAAEQVRTVVTENGWRPQAVLLTHGHLDHIWNAREVADHYRIPAYIHPDDRPMLSDPAKAISMDVSQLLQGQDFTEPESVIELFDGDHLDIAGLSFDVDHVPGHSPGSVSFRTTTTDDSGAEIPVVVGGDVLFEQGIGRTDLPGGDHEVLLASIEKKFFVLPDETVVLPGHGPTTTVGREKAENPFVQNL